MKKVKQEARLLISLLLLVLTFFSVLHVTYAYFTTTTSINGQITFKTLAVQFVYKDSTGAFKTKNGSTLDLFVSTGSIGRGDEFELALDEDSDAIQDLGIQNMETSTNCYVRFWFDAYIVDEDFEKKSNVNYGKYFTLTSTSVYFTNLYSSSPNSWCYYIVAALTPSVSNSYLSMGNSIVLSEDAPVEMTGEKLKLSISFEAVQEENLAFKTVFDDDRGYFVGDKNVPGYWPWGEVWG